MEKICYRVAYWFYQRHMIEEEDVNALRFAFELKITQWITHLTMLIVGWMIGRFIESLVYCLVFIYLRKTIKGYHAKTFHMCYILTTLTYLFVMFCVEYDLPYYLMSVLILLMCLLYFKGQEKKTIITITFVYFGLLIFFYVLDNFYYMNMFSLTYAIVLLMRLIGGDDCEDSSGR